MNSARVRSERRALVGFVARQAHIYRRFWAWEMLWLLYTFVSVASIGYLASGLGDIGVAHAADLRAAQLYLLAGALVWRYLSLVFMEVAYTVAWERWEGTIEYTFTAPVRRLTHLLGICGAAVVYGLARLLVVAVAVVPLFGVDLSHADLLGAGAVLLASVLPLVGLGVLVAIMPLLAPEKGEQMSMAVQGLLLLVSGVYYPVSVLPLPLRLIGDLSPLTVMLDGFRDALLRHRDVGDLLPRIGVLIAAGALLVVAGLWLFSRAERRAKRLGLLKRSG